ncbi:MAG: 5-(carboxyamino)imidazole ribonucleotide synthase [Gammaproteobacteria bacterium]|nr:5-(carboxyamino)imidazole ribonucleotide synthase [Gammaproteobacteria bacterium]
MKIGIVGAGQLGRMLALAGLAQGDEFLFLDTAADSPGAQVATSLLGGFDDAEQLAALAKRCDIVTFDVENLPRESAEIIARYTGFQPPIDALATAQDRLSEKRLFETLEIPTVAWRSVERAEDLHEALEAVGLPAVLKTRRLGYDGRGQVFVRRPQDLAEAWQTLGAGPMILEAFAPFDEEVSLIGVRNPSGQCRHYPLTRNVHWQGVLDYSIAPLERSGLQKQAESYVQRLLEHFSYAGVLSVEFFVVNGRLLANEMAPRVHNSGHWTIEGAATSQFENHLRGILDLPLGDTRATGHSAMVNFLGALPPRAEVLEIEGSHYHAYGKAPRPRRKIGHATIVCAQRSDLPARLERLRRLVGPRE